MARWNNTQCGKSRYGDPRRRQGTVSIVTLFAVLGLLILIGFVGNAGHAINRKIETQNAADSAAIGGAQWMARGMNAITATNHLLGEVTAIVTIHEALGGPEVDAGIEASTLESQVLDQTINNLKNFAPIRGLPTYGITPAITNADKEFLNFVADRMASNDGKHKAFATIYDSKITLKKKFAKLMIAKGVANLGLFVPPPWGYATAAGAYVVHLGATAEIAGMTKEWLILGALEEVAVQTKELKVKVLEEQLIPALAEHARLIAAMNENSASSALDALEPGLVGLAVQNSLDHLKTNFELTTFPRPVSVKLPVEPEPAPTLLGGQEVPEWDGNSDDEDSFDIDANKIVRDHYKQTRKIRDRIQRLSSDIQTLDKQETDVDKLLNDAPADSPQASELEQEKIEIETLRTKKQATIEELKIKLADLDREFGQLMKNVAEYQSTIAGQGGNLSNSAGHLPGELNQQQERYTQWVRATWPYVDALRAPILDQFDHQLRRSGAKQHFIKWTTRYTLVKAWQFRSGYRFEKTGEASGRWTKPDYAQPLQMYVMKNAFDDSGVEQKGREPWTGSNNDSKREAEQLFTIVGLAHREFVPRFSPTIFPMPHDRGMTTYAQSIIYNANRQETARSGNRSTVQPKVGWDTLNWDPATETPEWGSQPRVSEARWPWEVISSARPSDSVKVKLNWQAKLMPVTQSRLEQAALDNATGDLGTTLKMSALHFQHMSSH
jgi:hypothetical protein